MWGLQIYILFELALHINYVNALYYIYSPSKINRRPSVIFDTPGCPANQTTRIPPSRRRNYHTPRRNFCAVAPLTAQSTKVYWRGGRRTARLGTTPSAFLVSLVETAFYPKIPKCQH
ncbi:hypothetical protein EV426DRAFT_396325 [Tirmania nivea]|nr:hypothetical protein EV426DRAFT_396325 [Tirmania nivea]